MEDKDKDNQTISKNEDARKLQRRRIIILIMLVLIVILFPLSIVQTVNKVIRHTPTRCILYVVHSEIVLILI